MKQILSLGAGVQSSTLALMAAYGEVKNSDGSPRLLDCAIFADTQGEPPSVYKWLDTLKTLIAAAPHPFPVYTVSQGNLAEDELRIKLSGRSGRLYRKNSIPAFVMSPEGKKGLLGRKCTTDYKIVPIQRKTKELLGIKRVTKNTTFMADMWIGISTDEIVRIKPSRVAYARNIWPLIDADMSRNDCLKWMADKGFPVPPRSACTFCPFHSDNEWYRLKTDEPEEFAKAVVFERELQAATQRQEVMRGTPYLHNSCKNLDTVAFTVSDANNVVAAFGNECEGLCGV